MDEDLITTKQVAEALRCTQVYVTLLIKRGHFPGARKLDPTRRNSSFRVPRAELIAYQEKQLSKLPKSDE
ncbi:MAG TPA: hypothetical protein DCG54_09790 [Anaerolineae bacterium]|jgi:predicted DNA-binding transcriptional regulator AlpA|nr:hypothetical protein [Anaerolineae bacterium]